MAACSEFLGFPGGSAGKESSCNAGDLGLIPGLGRSPGEGKGYPLQSSGLENSMDCIVHEVAKSWTQLSNFHFHFHFKPRGCAQGACESKSQKITDSVFTSLVSGVPGLSCDFCKAVGKNSEREGPQYT